MVDRIFLEGLRIVATHGAHRHEREKPQEFQVDISVEIDLAKAGASDALGDTYDYGRLREIARSIFAGESQYLLERLASDIVSEILLDKRVREATVSVRKLHVYPDCVPGVSITRRQPSV